MLSAKQSRWLGDAGNFPNPNMAMAPLHKAQVEAQLKRQLSEANRGLNRLRSLHSKLQAKVCVAALTTICICHMGLPLAA